MLAMERLTTSCSAAHVEGGSTYATLRSAIEKTIRDRRREECENLRRAVNGAFELYEISGPERDTLLGLLRPLEPISEEQRHLRILHETYRRENGREFACAHLQVDVRNKYRAVCTKDPPGDQCTEKCPARPLPADESPEYVEAVEEEKGELAVA